MISEHYDESDVESNEYSEEEDSEGFSDTSPSHQKFTEMKEQMYQDKLADLKYQLAKLNDGSLPEYTVNYSECFFFNSLLSDFLPFFVIFSTLVSFDPKFAC